MKCLFFDLDGSLITTKSGEEFPVDIDDWKFVDGVVEKIASVLADPDWIFAIITNQGGIEAGFWTNEQIQAKLRTVSRHLADGIADILQDPAFSRAFVFAYCFSLNPEDEDRKPNPGMLLKVAARENLVLEECLFVGDQLSDMQAAHRAKVPFQSIEKFLA